MIFSFVACEPNCGRYMPAFITIPHIRGIKHFHAYQTKSKLLLQ
jgi:hypothetical protein